MEQLRTRSRRRLAATLVAVMVLAACTGGADDLVDGDDGAPAAQPAEEKERAGPEGMLRLSGWVEEHPITVAVALRGVAIDDAGHILLDIEAVNRGRPGYGGTSIAEFGVVVHDDLGNRYAYQRPEDHGNLRFVADERMTGTLAFEGPIDPDARYLDVAFNQSLDDAVPAAEDGLSQYPVFLFERVPLPGVGLEDEAVAGPSSDLLAEQVVEVGHTERVPWLDGFEITLVRYVVSSGVIRLELEAVNGTGGAVTLARGTPRLDDGRDSFIVYEANEAEEHDDRVVRLEPGVEASVTFSYRGTIAADAESLQLRLSGETKGQESTTHPYIEFNDIPVPD